MRRRDLLRGALAWAFGGCSAAPGRALPRGGSDTEGARPLRVVVVGGGLAGLAAALELQSRGVEVTVLEAQERPGGRILTVREPLTEGLSVEAGAKHVVGDPDLLSLMKSVGVQVVPRPRRRGPPLAQVTHFAGARRVFPVGEEPPEEHPLLAEERALGFRERLVRYLPAVASLDPLRDRHDDAVARLLDALPADEALAREGASPGLIAAMEGSFGLGDGFRSMSALSLVRDVANLLREIGLGAGGRVEGGTDQLPRALAAALGDALTLGARVTRVLREDGQVQVAFERRGVRSAVACDRLLLAVPSTVVERIDLDAAMPRSKRLALAAIGATSVTRIWAATATRPWLARGESAAADTDLRIGRVQDELEGREGAEGILSIYRSGADARRLGSLGAAPRIALALEDLERVHPGAREAFAAGTSKVWDDDPFARGGYAYFRPGQLTEGGGTRWAPEGPIHFAGCHTSHRPGFMHGALASARRAVREVLEARATPRSG